MTSKTVWIKLYYIGKYNEDPSVFPIDEFSGNIHHLKKRIKEEKPNRLQHVDADELDVYRPGTVVSNLTPDSPKLDPWDKIASLEIGERDVLIVVAPQQQQPRVAPVSLWKQFGGVFAGVFAGERLNKGRFYSSIRETWDPVPINFNKQDWEMLRRTISQVGAITEYKPVIDGMAVDDDPALGSSSSDSVSSNLPDALGEESKIAQGAHFVPHNKTCAVAFGPVAEMVLGQNLENDNNRTRTTKRHRLVVGVLETRGSKRQKLANTGLKHSPLNKLRIRGQKEYMDNRPCLMIVPLLSLDETKSWKSGDAYSALLCADGYDDGDGPLSVSRETVYKETCITYLPRCTNQDLALATDLLAHCTRGLAFSLVTGECFDGWTTNPDESSKLEIVQQNLMSSGKVNVPRLRQRKLFQPLRVAKIRFDANSDAVADPPDPYLLLLKSTIIWSWRNGEKLLPGCFEPEEEECSECEMVREYSERIRDEPNRPSDHVRIAKGLGLDADENTVFDIT